MGFEMPKYLQNYLNAKGKVPLDGYINNSTYYTQVSYIWQNYMQTVVRPCIAVGSAISDGIGAGLSAATGKAIVDGATRLCIGDRVFFEGDDEACDFLSDIWRGAVNFDAFLSRSQRYKFLAGSCVCKMNIDERGRSSLVAVRLDRTLPSFDECGNVTGCVFFLGLLTNTKRNLDGVTEYWLVEDRHYNEAGDKVVEYKVFRKDGVAGAPVLPSPYSAGVAYENLPANVRRELVAMMGRPRLNEEIPLPFRDGLGVWMLNRTATNSYAPDAPFGEPLLAGSLDLLWSIDVVFSGSLMDVINGEGKILVPKMFLQDTLSRLQQAHPGASFNVTTAELDGYGDETFVYVMPSGIDRDKMMPTPVQFEIRAQQYTAMWEAYQKEAVVRSGFSPTSIFPHLTPDGSAKTATEVTAEENLTRASVRQSHSLDIPVYNKMLREVLHQEGLSDDVQIKLSDYIGNKMLFDQNVRENYAAGLTPLEVAVQQIHDLSQKETDDYVAKIRDAKKSEQEAFFNDKDYFGEDLNADHERPIEQAGAGLADSRNGDKEGGY